MLIKQKSLLFSRNLAVVTFGKFPLLRTPLVHGVRNKGKSAIPLLFNSPEVLSSASDKAKMFTENFSKNFNLDDSGVPLPGFPSRINLKLHNISLSPKIVNKVIMNLDLSKAPGPDCIPMWL